MTGQPLSQEIDHYARRLDECLKDLRTDGSKFAEARESYQVAKAVKEMALRAEGWGLTVLQDLALGDKQVALLRKQKDIAQTMYEASREALMVTKLKLRLLSEQYGKEFQNTRGL